jgi:hypothetical protein
MLQEIRIFIQGGPLELSKRALERGMDGIGSAMDQKLLVKEERCMHSKFLVEDQGIITNWKFGKWEGRKP